MGAGSFPCGEGPAGLDPVPDPLLDPTLQRLPTAPVALWFDGATKDFLIDANGRYLSIHPVDQKVALALLIGLGTLVSVPGAGAAFRQIKRITAWTKNQATAMARAALRTLVDAKQIAIVSIDVEVRPTQGATLVAVSYVNLVTGKTPTFTAPTGSFTGL